MSINSNHSTTKPNEYFIAYYDYKKLTTQTILMFK